MPTRQTSEVKFSETLHSPAGGKQASRGFEAAVLVPVVGVCGAETDLFVGFFFHPAVDSGRRVRTNAQRPRAFPRRIDNGRKRGSALRLCVKNPFKQVAQ